MFESSETPVTSGTVEWITVAGGLIVGGLLLWFAFDTIRMMTAENKTGQSQPLGE